MEGATDSMADFKSREVIVPEVSKELKDNQVSAQVLSPRIHKGLHFLAIVFARFIAGFEDPPRGAGSVA